MLRTGLFLKLLGSYLALVVLCAAFFGFYQQSWMLRESERSCDRLLASRSRFLADLCSHEFEAGQDLSRTCSRIERACKELGVRFALIDAEGSILADSSSGAPLGSPSDLRSTEVSVRGPSGEPLMMRVSIGNPDLDEELAALWSNVLVVGGFAFLLAGMFGYIVAKQLAGPIDAIKSAATVVASGDYRARVDIRSGDELGELGQAFNRMASELGRRMETITTDRNKLLTILGGMVEGVIAIDAQERVLHLNAVAARWLGASREAAAGQLIWEVTRKVEVCEALAQALTNRDEVHEEIVLVDSREDQILELVAAPLLDSRGESAGAVVVLHDVTKLRKLEVVRSDFVANVSHELKTPLTVILGAVETMLDDEESMPKEIRQRFLKKVLEQSHRLSSLVSDLLVLSRVESATRSQDFTKVDLRKILAQSMQGLLPVAEKKSICFEEQSPESAAVLVGDPEALRQVVDNLLDNALKYSESGERVTARISRSGDRIRFEVEDTGIGIAPQEQQRIFERFYRIDKARSRKLGGTGLGLSIVKHIVLAHGGKIGVDSAPGRGSTFHVEFPATA